MYLASWWCIGGVLPALTLSPTLCHSFKGKLVRHALHVTHSLKLETNGALVVGNVLQWKFWLVNLIAISVQIRFKIASEVFVIEFAFFHSTTPFRRKGFMCNRACKNPQFASGCHPGQNHSTLAWLGCRNGCSFWSEWSEHFAHT